MRKFLIFFFAFFLIYCYSQNKSSYIFGYRLNYVPDSTNANNIRTEDFVLYVLEGKSLFTSENYLKRDSVIKSTQVTNVLNLSKVPNTRFKYVLIKEGDKIKYYETILKYKFEYEEDANFDWNLVSGETKKIGNYNCSRANLKYGGREWEAWFTVDIPINDGPFKFSKLPGLIVQISDSEKHYSFELISIEKNRIIENTIFDESFLEQHKKVSKSDFFKAVKNINDNIINELSSSGLTVSGDSAEKVKSNLKKKNNPIELNNGF